MFSLPRTGGACVLYRTPHTDYFTRLVQHSEPEQLVSLHDLPLSGGYVVMPFVVSPATPLLFIRPDEISRHPMAEADAEGTGKGENGTSAPVNDATTAGLSLPGSHATDEAEERGRYARSFASAHSRLLHGELQKMVLSRRLHVRHGGLDAYRLFLAACHSRPGCFVALWWTAATGCWLVATPEPLLEQTGSDWHTVALAGTVPYVKEVPPTWSEKNREEQAIVARFIASQLNGIANHLQQSATHATTAGNICHLCTDFRFSLRQPSDVRALLLRLHPTPAVCGLPRAAAQRAILTDEASPRRYYAGFSGPLGIEGETRLYVSLRCMEFTPSLATLYAGGGIMPESVEQEEWEETQRKLQTMLRLL